MRLIRPLLRAAAGFALALTAATSALAAPPFWAVRDADSTIYLFGTMHVLTADADWRTPAFDKALAESTQVWFEMDSDTAPETLARLVVQLGVDRKTPLARKVSPKTMAALRAAVKDQPKLAEMIEQMHPWTAAMMIQALPMMKAGMQAETGADQALTRDAKAGAKTVRYFETPEDQLRFFADLPLKVQVQMLEDSLDAADETPEETRETQAAWISGDIDRLGDKVVSQMRRQRPALYDALVRRRNAAWVKVLEAEMAGQGTAMVNVGALHMVGRDGLVVQLRKRGFKVDRLQ